MTTGLLRSEYLKVLTTKVWWGMLIGLLGALGLALLINGFVVADSIGKSYSDTSVEQHAANLYTSGQFFGVLLTALLATLLVTNEYRHQTATGTFLATPKRISVVMAKFIVALGWAMLYAFTCMVISIPVGAAVLSGQDVGAQLGEGKVLNAMLLNLVGFAVWAVLGIGIGTLLHSQVGAVVTLIVGYFGSQALGGTLAAMGEAWDIEWMKSVYWYLPYGATQAMTSAEKLADGAPAWWGGMLVVLAYGAVAAFFGSWLTVKRDIS